MGTTNERARWFRERADAGLTTPFLYVTIGKIRIFMPDDERWLPAPGWEHTYEVSDLGRVRSIDRVVPTTTRGNRRVRGKVKTVYRFKTNYPTVTFYDAERQQPLPVPVHRLVCRAFHGPPPSKAHVVAHWDGNPENNRADNLRWATAKENAEDTQRHGRRYGQNSKITEDAARAIIAAANSGERPKDIMQRLGLSRHTVYNVCKGNSWGHLNHLLIAQR
jgi:hypothetical protein